MVVQRVLPSEEAEQLLALVRELARDELAPNAAAYEDRAEFPRETIRLLGRSGLLGLAYPEEYGGGGMPYEVYLQVLEELASAWAAVALAVSVHTLSCYPVAGFGSEEQRKAHLPDMLGGELLGAYSLSEATSGSDAASLQARARRDGDSYVVSGTKAWVTHGGYADYYNVFCRTSEDARGGVSTLLVPADAAGLHPQPPERKMGLRSSATAQIVLDNVRVPAQRRIGDEGEGMRIALSALDGGRLGISAVATGLAQAALDAAVGWAKDRRQFGRPIADNQGVSFLLADMATGIEAARANYLAAARRRDAGLPYGPQAAMAKLFATDTAMKVTTDAVQVFGGYGYTTEYPVERYMREAKVMQIFEGTNQIQRLVIGRSLLA
ncbi:MAG TPA: acyl-CoA dehydrogenase family protein [Mycobacteriales bacterium]|jgi:alkylation response protein AidB-like acyl-CoA dehydrogenase|nr:acyl-CoA dehydrogenase family protein [Mycobacteriales bacterium]